mmetsp:Transcript_9733/g.21887  ORF Transcript_9733/g.21887 Transcript_9733/m.21887 type:complete len:149 (+) Transcript_9733:96-542(+)
MAQHAQSQPATRALELSKKRRRDIDSRRKPFASEERTNVVLAMNDLYLQATLLEATSSSFPSIEWSSEDEDDCFSDVTTESENRVMKEYPLRDSTHKKNIDMKTPTSSLLSSRKKRKFSFDAFPSNEPHMVRSIALQSHLSELTSWNF